MSQNSHIPMTEPGFRKKPRGSGVMDGTTMAGAIIGGTIGAFAGGPLVTVAGMGIGALAARAITRFAHEDAETPTHGQSPAV